MMDMKYHDKFFTRINMKFWDGYQTSIIDIKYHDKYLDG